MTVIALGYVGLGVADPAAWVAFATKTAGLHLGPGRGMRLRTDARAWRIALHPAPADDILYAGWEVDGPEALADLAARLAASGVAVDRDTGTLAARRGVQGILRCTDPSGIGCELFWGAAEAGAFTSTLVPGGFVGGSTGLGHLGLTTRDLAASRRFYESLLGLRLTDTVGMAIGPESSLNLIFLRCNERHHAIALGGIPVPRRLHHLMLETNTLDDVVAALDRAHRARRVVHHLGRHTNDGLISFYMRTPADFLLELGWGGHMVDEATWQPVRHDRISAWGHVPA